MTKTHADRVQLMTAAFAAAVGLVLALGVGSGNAATPQKDAKVSAPKAVHGTPAFLEYLGKGPTKETAGGIAAGIKGCAACHNGADMGQAAGFVKDYKSNEFVLLNESDTWLKHDVHSIALKRLDGELGQTMEKNLKYKVTEAPQCLTCHSVDLSPGKSLGEKVYKDFATKDGGVTCTACHGLSKTWQSDHFAEPTQEGLSLPWRKKTPEYKWSTGMADLRNPVVKAQLCVSCHVGNPDEGKVVTHDMYAAGHPPLPPFELASFMEAEPKHWGYPTDPKLKFFAGVAADERWPLFHFNAAKDESYLARHYAAGAIATLRAEAALLYADATADLDARAAGKYGDGMNYSRFDCYACHHDLVPNSDRIKRGFDGPPGRPTLRAAIFVPAGIVAKHAEMIPALKTAATGYDAQWTKLKTATSARPFGDVPKMKEEAKKMMDWCDGVLKIQGDDPTALYTPEVAAKLREEILKVAIGKEAADPEVAMALAWGALALAKEANITIPELELKRLTDVIPASVRVAPYSVMKDGTTIPVPAQYEKRMEDLHKFKADQYRVALTGLAPLFPKGGKGGK